MRRKNDILALTIIPIIVVGVISILSLINPDLSFNTLDSVRSFLCIKFGAWYLGIGLIFVGILIFLAVSKYGAVRLGSQKDKLPLFTYGSLIFTSVFAADIIFFSFHEWIYYYSSGSYAGLTTPHELAVTYPLFHWGVTPWSFYILPAITYAYYRYVRKVKCETLSDATQVKNSKVKIIVDIFSIVGLLLATTTTFSVTTPMMTNIIIHVFNLSESTSVAINTGLLLSIAVVYCIITLKRFNAISYISKVCTGLFFVVLAVFLFSSNTFSILIGGLLGIGKMIVNFIPMSVRMDEFSQSWTIFYWSYWISWCILVPFFISKISKGRTIREVVVEGLGSGVLGTYCSFIVLGNSSQITALSSSQIYDVLQSNPAQGIVKMILYKFQNLEGWSLGTSNIIFMMIVVLMCLFYISTFDAVIYALIDYVGYESYNVPVIGWSVVFISLPVILIKQGAVLSTLQALSIISALPISIILAYNSYRFLRNLFIDYKSQKEEV